MLTYYQFNLHQFTTNCSNCQLACSDHNVCHRLLITHNWMISCAYPGCYLMGGKAVQS